MSHHWLFITFWFSPVSLQYISNAEQEPVVESPQSNTHFALPFLSYLNSPQISADDDLQPESFNDNFNQFYGVAHQESQRKRRTAWSNYAESDLNVEHNDGSQSPYLATYQLLADENATNMILDPMDKKSFSPWGGKRNGINAHNTWTWKRSVGLREPSMPKRVRFSPWGGKRSGQMIFKPNSKSSRIIYASSLPGLTRIISNMSPGDQLNWAGLQVIPTHSLDKQNPIKILSLSSPLENKVLRDALPFKRFLDQLPKLYKPGHPYYDVNLKKDGKRKVKFSAWGGKRSPPIIGPIWTPTPTDVKESTLNSILLIRNGKPIET